MTLSRRHFVPLAAGAFAAAALPPKVWADRSRPVGIQLYDVNADLTKDPAGTLKKIAQIGYTEILVRHLTTDQPKVLASLERLALVRAALA